VMPVGGIKEKVIAAHRAGIEKIVLPKKNEKDLKEVPDDVKAGLQFYFVENISELFQVTLNIDVKQEMINQGFQRLESQGAAEHS